MSTTSLMKAALEEVKSSTATLHACIGFDGYIDSLFRVIKTRRSLTDFDLYSTITKFSDRAAQAAGRSADMELLPVSRRMGGNAPLMSEATGSLRVSTRCIGAMGFPSLDPVFAPECLHFEPTSLAPSATCIAFEFSDGKLMFGNNQPLLTLNWDSVTQKIGLNTLQEWYHECDLWAFVNWSFLLQGNNLIEGFLRDVVRPSGTSSKILFFDLADPSGRSQEELTVLFSLFKQLSQHARVVLSMNENESLFVAAALHLDGASLSPATRSKAIRDALGIFLASVHVLDASAAATAEDTATVRTIFHSEPAISTGGGDHFNGGFATALIHGLPPEAALAFGNLVASCYVHDGKSPNLERLEAFLESDFTAQS